MKIYPNAAVAILESGKALNNLGMKTESKQWQGKDGTPDTIEIMGHSFKFPMPQLAKSLAVLTEADLPWAEDHFQERISEAPSNPGESYKRWPYYVNKTREDEAYKPQGVFTHTYMERYWPREAHADGWPNNHKAIGVRRGIRYEYGDLNDVVAQLQSNPSTRQAYLPVWFPEDTGQIHGGRLPCSLGYLFMIREGYMHVHYYIRSCDYIRHFHNDIYLTVRLVQHMIDRVDPTLFPGFFHMHIGSFHVLATDEIALKKKIAKFQEKYSLRITEGLS